MLQHSKKNDKTPNTFVDGVPVKISEQYKPPRKIILPFSCQNCSPSEALYTEYDFRLENSVMNKLMEWKKTREEEAERRKSRVKAAKEVRQEIENFHTLTLGEVGAEEEVAERARHMCNPKLDDSILTPVCAKVNSPSSKPASSLFNLSDFESDNSSPFDNMELKTINEMEVLASILTSDNMKQSYNNNYNIIDKELNKNGLAVGKGSEWGQAPVNGYDNYQYSGYNGSVIPTGYSPQLNSVSENSQFYNFELDKFSNQCGVPVPTGQAVSVTYPETRQHLEKLVEETVCHADLNSQKSNSKSVPDIMNELKKELEESRERDIAAERMHLRTPPLPPESQKELPETSKAVRKPQFRKLSDPTANLRPELLRLARHISEMGFPLPRVARACKLFEGDDKKVIEFLLQVQSLEEKEYAGDLVERALQLKNFNTEETIKYLNSMMVLLDLGFDEAKVEEALKKTNSDRDKALDILIS